MKWPRLGTKLSSSKILAMLNDEWYFVSIPAELRIKVRHPGGRIKNRKWDQWNKPSIALTRNPFYLPTLGVSRCFSGSRYNRLRNTQLSCATQLPLQHQVTNYFQDLFSSEKADSLFVYVPYKITGTTNDFNLISLNECAVLCLSTPTHH